MNGSRRDDTGIGAVIFDWAGTIADFGSLAPVISIVEAFASRGVRVTPEEARRPMGLEKREHLRRMLADSKIAQRWKTASGADPRPRDVESLYEDLEPRLVRAVKSHSRLVPGVRELADELRTWGIRIGTTSGYLRPVMDILTAEAARQGFEADSVICPSDVPAGRPFPWMCFLNAMKLGVYPPRRMVKIGDTPADMHEGLNAGMWTIGVTLSGNEVGLSQVEVEQLTADERFEKIQEAERRLREASAHYVTESACTCRAVLARIEERIIRGEQPSREKTRERA